MRFRLAWLGIFAAVLSVSTAVLAQDTAQVTGTVTDSSGAAIPNAQVTVLRGTAGTRFWSQEGVCDVVRTRSMGAGFAIRIPPPSDALARWPR